MLIGVNQSVTCVGNLGVGGGVGTELSVAASGSDEGAGSGSTKMGFGDAGSASSVGNIGVGGGVIMELSVDESGSGFEGEESDSSAVRLSDDPARGLNEPRGLNDPEWFISGRLLERRIFFAVSALASAQR